MIAIKVPPPIYHSDNSFLFTNVNIFLFLKLKNKH